MNLISILHSALCNPESHFKTLSGITFHETIARLDNINGFIEGRINIDGEQYMIYMPIEPMSADQERMFTRIESSYLAPYTLLKDELSFNINNLTHRFDIIIQPLPVAEQLRFSNSKNDQVQQQLNDLEAECDRLHLFNLQFADGDIVINNGQLLLFRYHTLGARGTNVCIARLKEKYRRPFLLSDIAERYTTKRYELFEPSEGVVRFKSSTGYGFMDSAGEIYIQPTYLQATDFLEGRSVVHTPMGVGVIAKDGGIIINPIFESVQYDRQSSNFIAISRGVESIFSYHGHCLVKRERQIAEAETEQV